MSIISPFPQNSEINLYQGIPWGNDYKDIRMFISDSERNNYLSSKTLGQWTQCSIVRPGFVKLTGQLNDVLSANYMSFVNHGITSAQNERVFYCFVKSVNYVNINTVEVEYEIDWIQSYLFDFEYGECFVEREHVNDDTMGKWTLPENIDIGELVIASETLWTEESAVMVQILTDTVSVNEISNVVDGTTAQGYLIGNIGGLTDLLQAYNDSPERVVQLVMIAASMINDGSLQKFTKEVAFTRAPFSFSFMGETYIPQNKKLGCYPYMMFTVDNFGSQVEQYRYEDFGQASNTYSFLVEGMPIPKPSMQCIPRNYKGIGTVQQNCVTFENFPQCAWVTDTYKQWIAENGLSTLLSLGTTLTATGVNMAGSIATGDAIGFASAGLGAAREGVSVYEDIQNHKLHSLQLNGSTANSGLNYSRGWTGFRVTQFMIKPEAAKRIDSRLTRYGYRIDTPKKPNITGRQYFNYVKCNSVHVDGNIPVDAKSAMEKALLSGTTFWHTNNMDTIYTSNPIVGG